MATVRRSLEQRVADVERELEQLKAQIGRDKARWWEQIVGDFEGDKAFAEILRLAAENRRASGRNSG